MKIKELHHTVRRLYFATLEVRFILSLTFWKLSLSFNLRYLSQVFINFNNQWQFWNPHDKQISIPSLIFEFAEKNDRDNWQWKRWRRNYFLKNINCLQPQISQPKLHQIEHVGGVSESSWIADSKTVTGFQIWWGFHWENVEKLLSQSKGGVLYVFNLKYLSQNLVKLDM